MTIAIVILAFIGGVIVGVVGFIAWFSWTWFNS